jgi:SAM-dependent methyltransferase
MTKSAWQEYFDAMAPTYMAEEYAKPWQQEVDFYVKLLNLPKGSRILDLGCGPGRHSVELARQEYQVTGVDISAGMLAEAQKAADHADVAVEWIQADAVQFKSSKQYDAILCMLEAAIGFMGVNDDPLEHDLAILSNISAALKLGGRFLLGASNAFKTVRDYTQADVEDGRFDPVRMLYQGPLTWATAEGAEQQVMVRVRTYFPTELTALLRQTGFAVEHIWGGTCERRPIRLDEYMITIIARKFAESGL